MPSMETLEIGKKNTIQSISSYFGGEEEEDIPDMAGYEDADNLVENDPVRYQHPPSFLLFSFCVTEYSLSVKSFNFD